MTSQARDCGLWAAIFAGNAPLSRFGEGQASHNGFIRHNSILLARLLAEEFLLTSLAVELPVSRWRRLTSSPEWAGEKILYFRRPRLQPGVKPPKRNGTFASLASQVLSETH
jgi:hypothetical protein